MPQLSQLSEVYLSQFLWLAIALGFIFFVIARGMVPKIQATVDAREQRIAGDLEAAQKARAAADETEAAWRDADGRRARRGSAARAGSEGGERPRHRSARSRPRGQDQPEGRSGPRHRFAMRWSAARAEIEAVAADATQEMVAAPDRVSSVESSEAAAAVKAELNV